MARRSRRESSNSKGRRDAFDIANQGLSGLSSSLGPVAALAVEDRRTYHPDVYRPVRSTRVPRHRLIVPARAQKAARPARLFSVGFRNPSELLVCVRRKVRREVLLAKGRGGGGHRRPRRNAYSDVRC